LAPHTEETAFLNLTVAEGHKDKIVATDTAIICVRLFVRICPFHSAFDEELVE
jgi:hypothetical protein